MFFVFCFLWLLLKHSKTISQCTTTFFFHRNLQQSPCKPHRITHHLLLMLVPVHPLLCIWACRHMVLLSSMVHLFLHTMFHFLGDQPIITTMEAVSLLEALIDRYICLDHLLILVVLWWEMVSPRIFPFIVFCFSFFWHNSLIRFLFTLVCCLIICLFFLLVVAISIIYLYLDHKYRLQTV